MTNPPQPLVSIVTPVYNEAGYLSQCIESVLAQTYQSWDYTIVDNCSTDGSPEIAQRYAAKDPRIRVVQNRQFLKAIPNHNAAMREISPGSRYCKVVLGDDWIYPECLERMVAVAEAHPSVGVVGAYVLEGDHVICSGLPWSTRPISGHEICRRHLLEGLYVFGSANSVLYRADLVRNRDNFFNEANIHADTEACFNVLRTSDFAFVHQVLTYTRVRQKSLTAMSSDLQTHLAGSLQVLAVHGEDYLTSKELRTCLHSQLSDYYEYLGLSLLRRPADNAFWEYHRRRIDELGIGFSRRRVALGLLKSIARGMLNPKTTLDKWMHRYLRSAVRHGVDSRAVPRIGAGETL